MSGHRIGDQGSIAGWEQALIVLSMDRWAPVLSQMGISDQIVARPELARVEARRFLRRSLAPTAGARERGESVRRAWLAEALDRLADGYGDEQVLGLARWVDHIIADRTSSEWLATWRELLRSACGLVTADEAGTPLPADIAPRVCDAVRDLLDPARPSAHAQAVRVAAGLPPTVWEEELGGKLAARAGDAASLSVIEVSADQVVLAIVDWRTFSAWEAFESILTPTEKDALVTWATRQRVTLGLPKAPAWATDSSPNEREPRRE